MDELLEIVDLVDDYDDDEQLVPIRRPLRRIRERPDHFCIWTDAEFFCRFRLKKPTVIYLLGLIEDELRNVSARNFAVSPMNRLLLTLRFYATGTMFLAAGDFSGVSKSTACSIVKQVTWAIARLRPQFIRMPHTERELQNVQMEFYRIARFPKVVGALDCTHIRIQSPGGDNAEYYRNRKGFFSLNVQTVSDRSLKIRDIVVRWPGSAHDQVVFNNSHLKARLERNEWRNLLILADSSYENRPYLVTPFANPNSAAENLYNEAQIRTRSVVERQYGVWKRRFPALSLGMRVSLEKAQAIVVATAVLHNMACDRREDEPPVDPDLRVLDDNVPVIPHLHNNEQGNVCSRQRLVNEYFSQLLNEGR
ncbi:putative nuclease HARBI1 [Anabrus simplex]|uniref:putative nuclease HARBI1 n=1 Tax=Anabrus simplex TaxID=316456 RepID=UPI0035A30A30